MVDSHGCRCDCKKCGIAAVAAVIVRGFSSFVIHDAILGPHYKNYMIYNLDLTKSRMPFFALAHIAWGTAFACIYARGYEADRAPIGQGIRFGVWAWLMATVSPAIISYVIYPYSAKLIGGWIGLEFVECLIIGVIVSLLYCPQPQ